MAKKADTPVVAPEDRVPFFTKLAYALGGPVDILGIWILVSIAYPLFNMDLKMRPLYVSIILMSLRLWDGIIDPLMGWISDNTRTRWGRRRPFILVGSILAGITYPLMFWFPMDSTPEQAMFWVIGFGILFYTFFTIWVMPYQSLLMEMTPDYNERTRVTAVRGYFQTLAGFVNGWVWFIALLPFFAHPETGEPSTINGMRHISLYIGAVILVLGIIPAIFVKERYYESDLTRKQKKVGLRSSLKETFGNGPFVLLCVFTVFFLLGTAIYDSYGRYVGVYYVFGGDWGKGSLYAGVGTFVFMAFNLLFIMLFRKLSEKIGKVKCLYISVGMVLVSAATTWWTYNPAYPIYQLINTMFIGAGYAGLWLMIPSMQIDVVDLDELKTGERREGSFASIFSWVLKLSFCVGFLLSGPLLEYTGFDANYTSQAGGFDVWKNQAFVVDTNAPQPAIEVGYFAIDPTEQEDLRSANISNTNKAGMVAVEISYVALPEMSPYQSPEEAGNLFATWLKEIKPRSLEAAVAEVGLVDAASEELQPRMGFELSLELDQPTDMSVGYIAVEGEAEAEPVVEETAEPEKGRLARFWDHLCQRQRLPKELKSNQWVAYWPATEKRPDKDQIRLARVVIPKNGLNVDQPDAVYTNMRVGYLIIPVASLVLAMILLKFFRITPKKAAEIRAQLEERRGKV